MRSLCCMYICVSCLPYQIWSKLVGFYGIQYGDHVLEGNLDAILFILSCSMNHSKAVIIHTYEVDSKLAPCNVEP
jgi:hypothetical protein